MSVLGFTPRNGRSRFAPWRVIIAMLTLWIVLALLVLFLVWAGRRVSRHGGTQTLEKSGERAGPIVMGKASGGRDHPDDTKPPRTSER
jgi:hypothetical protein